MKKFAQIKLAVSVLRQGDRYVVHSPALDLSTSARSEKKAKKRFAEAALLFIEELDKTGTLNEVLRELGWRHEHKQWAPPQIISQEAIGLRLPVVA